MTNEITAYFKGRIGVAESVYQNDYGIIMTFDGIDLPAHFDCYFSRLNQEESIPVVGSDNRVVIPNSILANSGNATIHIPLHEGANDSRVEYVIYFKIIGRARPEDDGTPAQMTAIEQALALLQNPIGNIETIVNEALAFTSETFDEMQAEIDETLGGFRTELGEFRNELDTAETDQAAFETTIDNRVSAALGKSSLMKITTPLSFSSVGTNKYRADGTITVTDSKGQAVKDFNVIEQRLYYIDSGHEVGWPGADISYNYAPNTNEIFYAVTIESSLTPSGFKLTTLLSGSFGGELTDIRLGANGVTYDSAGAAVRAQISELKSDLSDITETVYSTNIFNQSTATITEGKYLNPNSGNEGTNTSYCYVNDFIPVKPSTTYYGTVWDRNTLALMGAFNGFVVFYTSDKAYISGLSGSNTQNPFTTPENCAYMRISMSIAMYNSSYYMFEESSTQATEYIPYNKKSKLKLPIFIVDINGNGDFTSIASAVNTLPDGSAILVMPGTYEENVKAWAKEIHIIGIDREACVLKDTSGNYATPPLEIGAGSVQNMSIIEQAEGAGTENMGAYAIHVESNNLYNKKLLIRNCYIYSDSSSTIGMGLRGGCSVRIEDCEIICAGSRVSTGAAPLYFHDADAQAYWGTANLYLHGNVLRNTASTLFSMLTINSIHAENTTYMHMMYNIFVRSKTPSIPQKFNTWNTSGNTDADGWNGLSHMYLEDDSFGNNLSELNYS